MSRKFWIVALGLWVAWMLFAVMDARCDNCPGWPCRSNADCNTGGGCACSGSATGPGVCVGGR